MTDTRPNNPLTFMFNRPAAAPPPEKRRYHVDDARNAPPPLHGELYGAPFDPDATTPIIKPPLTRRQFNTDETTPIIHHEVLT